MLRNYIYHQDMMYGLIEIEIFNV